MFQHFSFLFLRVLPLGTLSSSIGSSPTSEGVLTVSGGYSEGIGGCQSMASSECGLMLLLSCRSIRTLTGLGGCGCFAANSSWVRIFTALQHAVDSVGVVDRCSGVPHQAQGLQPPEHLSFDLLHYADDPLGHAGLHCYLVQVSKEQPSLAAQQRSMSGMEYRSMSNERCWSTEGECCRSTVVREYQSTELVYGSTVVEQNRATHKCCCRSMRSALPCGWNVPNLQDLVRIAVEFPGCFWYC
ncbi:hypothetical protein DY000_02014346 [Brassica cretica]|uniref:SREBP regulating gene protein n=1 Tax=Brassica cretica TaxID=69181 RepID=A0ABQ7D2Z8_BRACR|nr:hypothetical protein DY000_02014346 [Brassica cretica]